MGEITLFHHSLHQHGTDHPAPANQPYSLHHITSNQKIPERPQSAASTASPISFVPTFVVPGS